MARLLLIIAIAAVGWYLYRRLTLGGGNNNPAGGPAPGGNAAPVMNRCAECGVHAAEGDGVRYQNLFFCSPEHLDAYLRKRGPG